MNTMSLNKKMETLEELANIKINADDNPSEMNGWFEDWLKDAKTEYEMDELAPVLELDYTDFEDYINYLRDEAMEPYRAALRFMDRNQWKKKVAWEFVR